MIRPRHHDPGLRFAPKLASASLGIVVPAIAGTTGPAFIGLLGLVAVAVLVLVVCPAVWSKDQGRMKAALEVLRVIFRR